MCGFETAEVIKVVFRWPNWLLVFVNFAMDAKADEMAVAEDTVVLHLKPDMRRGQELGKKEL